MSLQNRPLLRYGGAVAISIVALGIRYWIDASFGTRVPVGISVLAVTLSAFFFGAGPGVVTTLATVLIGVFALGLPAGVGVDGTLHVILIGIFIVNGIAVATAAGLLQKALRRRNEAERELELVLRREKLARASAEHAYEARARLMSRVAHELRTPLAPARMLVRSALAEGGAGGLSRTDLEIIDRSIAAQMQLADELLDHSQLGVGKLRLKPKPIQAVAAIREAIDACTAMEDWNGPRPRFVSKVDEHVEISADPLRFQQIICNLLRNAGKFTPRDGTISVQAENGNGSLVVRVQDTGVGIDEASLPHIFDEFDQGTHHHGRYGGMGLGLAIARSLAALHGGTILARSEGIGKGAEFVLQVPLQRQTEAAHSSN